MIKSRIIVFLLLGISTFAMNLWAYPYDGYNLTGIDRLLRLQMIMSGEIPGKLEPVGQQKTLDEIHINLPGKEPLCDLPDKDPGLQAALEDIIPDRAKSYSVAVMDISPCQEIRYAARLEDRGYQPGSVGKLAIITGLFHELETVYPNSFDKRRELLKNKNVRAGGWAMSDHHTVPFFDPETKKYFKRTVQEKDVFSLYEWADHMMSVSNNGAASVVWREVVLMRQFGKDYPDLTEEQAEKFFKEAPRAEVTDMAISVVNDPLRELEISEEEWRLGSLFTQGGKNRIGSKGGSTGTPKGLMKWMVALESGNIVDPRSSLEIKRLMYITDRRIRYAAANQLDSAAVYFKSGSFYKCDRVKAPGCGKYEGNVYNYMNSVAIVEQTDGSIYLVALMTNVLGKNSNWDHRNLAKRIDDIVRKDQKKTDESG